MRQQAARTLGIAPIKIDGIGQGLKSVEGETDGQRPMPLLRFGALEAGPILQKPRHVLKGDNQSDVEQNAAGHQKLTDLLVL